MLQSLLEKSSCKLDDLDAVAFGSGPGSFTGLRIACGLAQGLAFARALPVLGVSAFEAMAQESGAERVLACIDARMREVYCCALQRTAQGWKEVQPARCLPPQAVQLPAGNRWVGCGSGFSAFPDLLQNKIALVQPQIHPTAFSVALLAAPRLAAGQGVDAANALPTYLRDKVAFTRQELQGR
jgi:tRNA threonylcarbamoyladenosine biosynthesis protein TsaB